MAGKTERARHAGGLIVAHVVGVIVAIVLGLWTSTQWIASMLAFQPELGRPWFTLQTYPVYLPWKYLVRMFYFVALSAPGAGIWTTSKGAFISNGTAPHLRAPWPPGSAP